LLHKIDANGRVLLVVATKSPNLTRAFNNLADVTVVQARYLNVYEVLNADKIVIEKAALAEINEWLGDAS
jgi:large subunit ribosomal protein L4